jgi:uncharacterized membrane protein (Fun14 family)
MTEKVTDLVSNILPQLLIGLIVGAVTAYGTIGVIDTRLALVEKAVERIAVSSGVSAVNVVRLDALDKRVDRLERLCTENK